MFSGSAWASQVKHWRVLVLRAFGVRDARVIEVQGVSFESFAVPDSRGLS